MSQKRIGKFCANISMMFTELPFLERYEAARQAGFRAVESGFPFGYTVEQVAEAREAADVEQVLINVYTGNVNNAELGFAAVPGKEYEFESSIHETIKYAKALRTNKIHIMAGRLKHSPTAENDTVYERNLRHAAEIFAKENILGLIEPINIISIPLYYMNSYNKAIDVVNKINSPNLKIMVDIFHMQLIRGKLTRSFSELENLIGHVQIAQAPGRNEPDTDGELNYRYVFALLKSTGYHDWIGLEYRPKTDTVSGLKWISDFGFRL